MTVEETLKEYDLLDVAILHHGYAEHLRDYEVLTEAAWSEGAAGRYRYTFTHCVYSSCETRVPDDVWPRSWDDHFTDYAAWQRAGEPEGYVWGTRWSLAYPGLEYIKGSPRAADWTQRLGHEMHEIALETNTFFLVLVFHDVVVQKLNEKTDLSQVHLPLKG